jgi:hypothetical protein
MIEVVDCGRQPRAAGAPQFPDGKEVGQWVSLSRLAFLREFLLSQTLAWLTRQRGTDLAEDVNCNSGIKSKQIFG